MALEWLTWYDHQLRQQVLYQLTHEDLEAHDMMARAYPDHPHLTQRHYLQHVGDAGEHHVPDTKFTVDGFHRETSTLYEFHGCFWHGCPKCYPTRDKNICTSVPAPCMMSTKRPNKNDPSSRPRVQRR